MTVPGEGVEVRARQRPRRPVPRVLDLIVVVAGGYVAAGRDDDQRSPLRNQPGELADGPGLCGPGQGLDAVALHHEIERRPPVGRWIERVRADVPDR